MPDTAVTYPFLQFGLSISHASCSACHIRGRHCAVGCAISKWISFIPCPNGSNATCTKSCFIMWIKIQPDATVCRYLFTAKLLYLFRVSQHPSSGVLKTVTAASGTGHNTGTATSPQRGLFGIGLCESSGRWWYLPLDSHKPVPIRPRWRRVAVPILWPVPEAAGTVFSTPDGCCDTRNK